MTSSLVNHLTPLFILLGVAGIIGVFYSMDRLPRWLYRKPQRRAGQPTRLSQGDEEQGRTNTNTCYWVSLDTLPRSRSSSTAPMVPNAVPPAYLPRTRQGESAVDEQPWPLRDLPSLYHGCPLTVALQQQVPPQSQFFILADDSSDSLEISMSPVQQSPSHIELPFTNGSIRPLEGVAPPVEEPLLQSRITFLDDRTKPTDTESAEYFNPISTTRYFQAPEITSPGMDPFSFPNPLPLSPRVYTRTGTVNAHKPIVVSTNDPESDTATGSFVSNMVKSMEKGKLITISSKAEECDQDEPSPSPLLNSVLSRLSNVREHWTKIDL